MKGILFDMPNVIEEATCHICPLNMDHRCETVTGDFFEQIPAGADAYYMPWLLSSPKAPNRTSATFSTWRCG